MSEDEQQGPQDSLGQYLRRERELRNITLEEISEGTKITVGVLQALEADSLEHLAPVYVRGFLRAYARYMGLDVQDVILRYEGTQADRFGSQDGKIRSCLSRRCIWQKWIGFLVAFMVAAILGWRLWSYSTQAGRGLVFLSAKGRQNAPLRELPAGTTRHPQPSSSH